MQYLFDVDVACKYGVDKATILNHFGYIIFTNRASGKHFNDGRTWCYGSARSFAEIWPFWPQHKIRRLLRELVNKDKVLVTGNYNKIGYDRTCWYAFVDEKPWFASRQAIIQKRRMDYTKTDDGFSKNGAPIPIQGQYKSKDINQGAQPRKEDLDLVVARDQAIANGKRRFIEQVNRLLKPTGKDEPTTFARIARHLVKLCEAGDAKPDIFDQAIGWIIEAKTDGNRPKALFVAIVKERAGFKGRRKRAEQTPKLWAS